jgi:peptide/nickel transport system permease protein
VLGFLCRRILHTLPALWGIATIVFFLIHLVPGDPVEIMLGENALPSSKENLRAALRLDRPMHEQYVDFWKGLIKADLGNSIISRRPVRELIAERFSATASLALVTVFWTLLLAIPTGLLAAAFRERWPDKLVLLFSIFGVSMPSFWIGPLFMLFFSVHLGLLPVSEKSGWQSFVLPSLTLGIGLFAVMTRMTRASLAETLKQDYITTARSKGLEEKTVLAKHALKNALIPVITIFGLQLGGLLAGTLITETIFDWPGIGELVFRAIQSRDYPLVQGCVLVIATTYVLVNFLADILYSLANPRVELR